MDNSAISLGLNLIGFVYIFLVIAAIMTIFIPFWIFRIRNEVIAMNKTLNKLIEINTNTDSQPSTKQDSTTCQECGYDNNPQNKYCEDCRANL